MLQTGDQLFKCQNIWGASNSNHHSPCLTGNLYYIVEWASQARYDNSSNFYLPCSIGNPFLPNMFSNLAFSSKQVCHLPGCCGYSLEIISIISFSLFNSQENFMGTSRICPNWLLFMFSSSCFCCHVQVQHPYSCFLSTFAFISCSEDHLFTDHSQ